MVFIDIGTRRAGRCGGCRFLYVQEVVLTLLLLPDPNQRRIAQAAQGTSPRSFGYAKGYGFVAVEGQPDVFCHFHPFRRTATRALVRGDEVEFDIVQGEVGHLQTDRVIGRNQTTQL